MVFENDIVNSSKDTSQGSLTLHHFHLHFEIENDKNKIKSQCRISYCLEITALHSQLRKTVDWL